MGEWRHLRGMSQYSSKAIKYEENLVFVQMHGHYSFSLKILLPNTVALLTEAEAIVE